MPPRPPRRRSDSNAGPVIVDERTAPPAPASTPTPERAKPVRTTLVLDADEYDALQSKVLEAQRITGRRGVASAEIVRNLLALAHEDPELWGRVLERITQNGGNRRGRK